MKERLFVITDAVTDTDKGDYHHKKQGDKYEADGILSGSALTMNKALQNLVYHCSIELMEALRMLSLYPARVIRLDSILGKIEKGYQANLVVLDQNLNSVTVLPE
jgi:N-acetylglucosamine-6-phosphate deacetylase